jgi:hypothetical protein
MGEALVQLSLSNPLYDKFAPEIFSELPDTEQNLRKSATLVAHYAFAAVTKDDAIHDKIPTPQIVAAVVALSRARDARWPGKELIIKPEVLRGPKLGAGLLFEAGPHVGTPTSIIRWQMVAGSDVTRTVNANSVALNLTRPN